MELDEITGSHLTPDRFPRTMLARTAFKNSAKEPKFFATHSQIHLNFAQSNRKATLKRPGHHLADLIQVIKILI